MTVINNNQRMLESGATPEELSLYFGVQLAIVITLLGFLLFKMMRDIEW